MIGWIILAAWLIGVVSTWRSFAMGLLIGVEDIWPGHLDSDDRAFAALVGLFLAVAWPITLPGRATWRLVKGRVFLQTPREKAAAEKRELEALRRQARELGLPMPKEDD